MPTLPDSPTSYWVATSHYPHRPALDRNIEVDVAIIGGGVTGITAALLLQREGKRVAIVEARRVAEGVTGNTTAHLTEAIDTRYVQLIKDFGIEGARLAAQASTNAITQIERFVKDYGITCRFRRLPGYLYTERDDDLEALHGEYEAAKSVGLAVTMTDAVPLPFKTRAAIAFANQAEFHIRDYLEPLCDALERGGGRIFENTRVTKIEDGDPCELTTEHGTVRARDVIMAANVPLSRILLQTKIAHYRSYALAIRVQNPELNGLFWDTDDPYHYIRGVHPASTDSSSGSLVIVGGEDHKTGTIENTDEHYERLLAYARARFLIEEVGFRWSAQVIETVDGLPYIGRDAQSTHVYVATGYSGNGITFGTAAASILRDQILAIDNPMTALFEATRIKPIAAAKDFLRENADVPMHFIADRLRAPEATSVADVAAGEGKIVRVNGKKLAVYRDDAGTIHALSPVCPHLGCYVAFNHAEKSWDCPCHGSRFDTKGDVLNGPTSRGLKPQVIEDDAAK